VDYHKKIVFVGCNSCPSSFENNKHILPLQEGVSLMTNYLDNEIEEQITQCVSLLKNVLGQDLLGVYLYGSSIVGGLQKYSDIDIFVVTGRSTTYEEKAKLVTNILQISGIYQKSSKPPIEMMIVIKSEINPWHYPPKFDFQYGDWLRTEFESGNIEPWATKNQWGQMQDHESFRIF